MSLIHLLYPKKCPVCGSAKTTDEKDVFCPDCYKNLIWVEEPCCKHCGKPVASEKVELCYDCGRRDSQLRQGTALPKGAPDTWLAALPNNLCPGRNGTRCSATQMGPTPGPPPP